MSEKKLSGCLARCVGQSSSEAAQVAFGRETADVRLRLVKFASRGFPNPLIIAIAMRYHIGKVQTRGLGSSTGRLRLQAADARNFPYHVHV